MEEQNLYNFLEREKKRSKEEMNPIYGRKRKKVNKIGKQEAQQNIKIDSKMLVITININGVSLTLKNQVQIGLKIPGLC